MQVKDTAAALVLGLLFVSIVTIFRLTDQNPLVVGLSVILIAICLIVVELGTWREVGIIGTLAAVVSVIAVYMLGRERFGGLGATLLPIVWAFLLAGMFVWLTRNIQEVPGDRTVLVRRTYTNDPIALSEELAPPLIPFFERPIATIPMYPLSTDADVPNVNTAIKDNVNLIRVHVEYQIADRHKAALAMHNIPNRGLIQNQIAKSLNKSVDEARADLIFWEQLLESQMQAETDDVVRNVVFTSFDNARDVYQKRNEKGLPQAIRSELQTRVGRWGVDVTTLAIDTVDIAADKFNAMSKKELTQMEHELEASRVRRLLGAEAEGDAERVARLVNALRQAKVNITPVMVQDIIASLASDPDERLLEHEIKELLRTNGAGKSGDKK